MKQPFFILGCVRSGTTLLRNILRRSPALACPEETHFYRWADPFGTARFVQQMVNNRVLVRHRSIDGIEEADFLAMLEQSDSRAALYELYMQAFLRKKQPATRWFDKTPQNVYGAALLAAEFPDSKFIHIVRDPHDVVASLKLGKVMHVPGVVGACSYWLEAVKIMRTVSKACPGRVYEVRYEDLTAAPEVELKKMLSFIEEDFSKVLLKGVNVSTKTHDREEMFTVEESETIKRLCGDLGKSYGYFS